jgi:desulfoferrodoxin (superoxide reductase-like protein)
MKRKISIIIIIIWAFLVFYGCGDEGTKKDGKIVPPKFHSHDDEGYWMGKADSHMPVITFLNSDKTEFEATVPLQPTLSPRHYIEVIVLVKGKKQVDAVKYKPSFKKAKAKFKIKDQSTKDYWVVAKCNLHDMWRIGVWE